MRKHRLRIKKDIYLSSLTTFKVGGLAKYYIEVKTEEELISAVAFAQDEKMPIFVLGEGSNVLVSDSGFDGLVIKFLGDKILFKKQGRKGVLVDAESGASWDMVVALAVNKGLQGIECMSGIPGTVGAAPVQNIGAYGQELKDVFVRLSAYDCESRKFVTFDKKSCLFGYRDSYFKRFENKDRYIITKVLMKLFSDKEPLVMYESLKAHLKNKKIRHPTLLQLRNAILELREQKHYKPSKVGNAGSFFKNPFVDKTLFRKIKEKYPELPFHKVNSDYKLFAGWLIEQVGWKGRGYKDAKVSDKHALVITNPEGKASASDIKKLAEKIQEDVYKKFEVKLELEVQLIGFKMYG